MLLTSYLNAYPQYANQILVGLLATRSRLGFIGGWQHLRHVSDETAETREVIFVGSVDRKHVCEVDHTDINDRVEPTVTADRQSIDVVDRR